MFATTYQTCQAKRATDAQVLGLATQYRPWLAFKGLDQPRFDSTETDVAVWGITNVGTLPAHARWEGSSSYREPTEGLPTKHDQLFFGFDGAAGEFDLGPAQSMVLKSDMKFFRDAEKVRAVKAGDLDAFICINVEYTGPDRKEAAHSVRTCARYIEGTWVAFPAPGKDGDRP